LKGHEAIWRKINYFTPFSILTGNGVSHKKKLI